MFTKKFYSDRCKFWLADPNADFTSKIIQITVKLISFIIILQYFYFSIFLFLFFIYFYSFCVTFYTIFFFINIYSWVLYSFFCFACLSSLSLSSYIILLFTTSILFSPICSFHIFFLGFFLLFLSCSIFSSS